MSREHTQFDDIPGMFDDCYTESTRDPTESDDVYTEMFKFIQIKKPWLPKKMKQEILFPEIVDWQNRDVKSRKKKAYKGFMHRFRLASEREVNQVRAIANEYIKSFRVGLKFDEAAGEVEQKLRDLYKEWEMTDPYYNSYTQKAAFNALVTYVSRKVMVYGLQAKNNSIPNEYKRKLFR